MTRILAAAAVAVALLAAGCSTAAQPSGTHPARPSQAPAAAAPAHLNQEGVCRYLGDDMIAHRSLYPTARAVAYVQAHLSTATRGERNIARLLVLWQKGGGWRDAGMRIFSTVCGSYGSSSQPTPRPVA